MRLLFWKSIWLKIGFKEMIVLLSQSLLELWDLYYMWPTMVTPKLLSTTDVSIWGNYSRKATDAQLTPSFYSRCNLNSMTRVNFKKYLQMCLIFLSGSYSCYSPTSTVNSTLDHVDWVALVIDIPQHIKKITFVLCSISSSVCSSTTERRPSGWYIIQSFVIIYKCPVWLFLHLHGG